jgi:hypothetical protein
MIFVLFRYIVRYPFFYKNLRIMKILINSFRIGLIMLAVVILNSCEKKSIDSNGIGTVEFSMNLPADLSQAKSATGIDSTVVSYQLMISVEDTRGNPIMNEKLIPLYSFGSSFLSAKFEIKSGEYKLTKFIVMNPNGAIIYAAPVAGSPNAYLVNRPLPMPFNIFPEKVTTLPTEVLTVGNQSPSVFGYAAFGVQIVKPLEFWTMCTIGFDNPMIMAPIQITTAKLTISNNNGWLYSFNLIAAVNHLVIRGGSENYTFLLEKEGYPSQKMQFTAKQLTEATKENPLILKIPAGTGATKVLYLQPGPEQGKDAMISNLEPDKNFGTHKYFEATYISEPVLTVMRSNKSLIWFDLSQLPKPSVIKKVILKLSYDVPVPWDSTIFLSNSGATYSTKPAGVLQQIIEPWEEDQVTWNKQPKTIELNQVFIPPFIRNVNFIEVDVTNLFVSVAANPLPNYGMLFKLNQNEKFKGFRFASSDFPLESLRPGLSVYYTPVLK